MLEGFDAVIRESELEISKIAINQRLVSNRILFYSIPCYLSSIFYYYFVQPQTIEEYLKTFGVILGFPLMYFINNKIIFNHWAN